MLWILQVEFCCFFVRQFCCNIYIGKATFVYMNHRFMCIFVTFLWETFVAIFALVWFIFGVNPFVSSAASCHCEILTGVVYLLYESFHVEFCWLSVTNSCCNIYIGMDGFSLVWILSCRVLLLVCEKLFLQYLHWYGFSLVWILSWIFLCSDVEKLLLQYLHR